MIPDPSPARSGEPPAGASDAQLRLFAAACCRVMWPWLTDDRLRASVEAGERFARGVATAAELAAAHAAAREAYACLDGHDMDLGYRKQCDAWAAAVAVSGPTGTGAASTAAGSIYWRDELAAHRGTTPSKSAGTHSTAEPPSDLG